MLADHAAAAAAANSSCKKFRLCCNANLRRGVYKMTEMSVSQIHGFGLFLTDPKGANKGG